jgi:hypothetical protein
MFSSIFVMLAFVLTGYEKKAAENIYVCSCYYTYSMDHLCPKLHEIQSK